MHILFSKIYLWLGSNSLILAFKNADHHGSNRQSPSFDDDVRSVSSDTTSSALGGGSGSGTAGDAEPKTTGKMDTVGVKRLRKKRGGKPMPDEVPFLGEFYNTKATHANVTII